MSITAGKWKSVSIITGVYHDISLNQDRTTLLTWSGGVGIDFTSNPFITAVVDQGLLFPTITKQESKISNSLALNTGFKLSHWYKKVNINAGIDFFSSSPKFNGIGLITTVGNFNTSFQQKINIIDLYFGLGILF